MAKRSRAVSEVGILLRKPDVPRTISHGALISWLSPQPSLKPYYLNYF